ncbi:MAG: nucleotidyltransferase domain-containing protein [Candidatus Nanopelagicales bacterium]|nr:nucleotidyltransferase domain-containing protein [Candidatus Nanopelagicales bacterium]
MELNRPFAAVTPTLDGDALMVLAVTDRPMTAPVVAAVAGSGSEAGMRKALRRLTAQGLVIRERTGHHDSYVLNRAHLLAAAIDMIAQSRVALRERLAQTVSHWDPAPTFVSLFGSAAHGVMKADSDVDVLVVRPDTVDVEDPMWVDQLIQLATAGRLWTGNDLRILELTEEQTRSALADGEKVMVDIATHGYRIFGDIHHAVQCRQARGSAEQGGAVLQGVRVCPRTRRR